MVKEKNSKIDPLSYVDQRNSHMQLKQCHKNWLRKIEIAELEANKARKILKKHGIPWEDE
jgi:hypothetical protein